MHEKANWIKQLVDVGTHSFNDEYTNEKIKMTNLVCLIYQLAFTCYYLEGLFVEKHSELLLLGVVCVLCFVYFLNFVHQTLISRLTLFLVPLLLSTFYKAITSAHTGVINYSFGQNDIVILMIPLVVFDARDWLVITFCWLLDYLIAITLPLYYHLFSEGIIMKPIELGIGKLTVITGNFIICGSLLYSLAYRMMQNQQRNKKLLEESKAYNINLVKSEENLNEQLVLLEQAKLEEQRNVWMADGLNMVTKILMTNEISFEKKCDQLIAKLVKYAGANQGALYFVSTEGGKRCIVLQSCYAYGRKKFVSHAIEEGNGLLGQAILEKDQIYLKEIPDHYIKITSGLGEALPKYLLISPLLTEDSAEGVIELATFKEIELYKRKFFKEVGKIIASHIITQQMILQSKKMYDEVFEKSARLSTQEEEIRQNMEELQALQEVMMRNEMSYKKTIEDLENRLQ
jgi:hypothetical protein